MRTRGRDCSLAGIGLAIVPYAQLVFRYARFDKSSFGEFCQAEEKINVLLPGTQLAVYAGIGCGEGRRGIRVLVTSVQQAVERCPLKAVRALPSVAEELTIRAA